MKTTVAISFAAIVFGCAAASAADLPMKAPLVAPPPSSMSWTGCYVGADAGFVWGRSNLNIPAYPFTGDINMDSFAGGPFVGCNYQFASNWVIGVEGDWSWMDLNGDVLTGGGSSERYAQKWDWSASVRGRLGFVMPSNTLWYVTGGGAWAHLDNALFTHVGAPNSTTVAGTHSGWTIGAGVEHALIPTAPYWIVGLEYLYAKYDRVTYVCSVCGPVNFDLQTHTVRLRLSVKFL